MRRDHIVSVRLTDAELAELKEMGVPSDVLRELLREAIGPKVPASSAPAVPTSTAAAKSWVTWGDGTFGAQWPASVTA